MYGKHMDTATHDNQDTTLMTTLPCDCLAGSAIHRRRRPNKTHPAADLLLVGLQSVLERVLRVDLRLDLALLDELEQLAERVARLVELPVDHEAAVGGAAAAERAGELLLSAVLDESEDRAEAGVVDVRADLDVEPRRRLEPVARARVEVLRAKGVEAQVEPLVRSRVVLPEPGDDVLLSIVDDDVGAERLDQRLLLAGPGGDDERAEGFADLDGERADAAAAAVDEDGRTVRARTRPSGQREGSRRPRYRRVKPVST